MTIYDYLMTMKKPTEKRVKVAELKAALSAYLREARAGRSVVVCDRDTPIARIVPYNLAGERLSIRHAVRPLHTTPLPAAIGHPIDVLATLAEERQPHR